LSRLDYLALFLQYDYQFYVPNTVIEEINIKQDLSCIYINKLVNQNKLISRQISLLSLANSINERLGRGEAEAIALATELQSDYIILDDYAARKEAIRLGLNVKGTLAIIKKMMVDNKLQIDNLEQFYQELLEIKFRVKRSVFEAIFID
jgi:predicted nucleic acid-binding protein